MRILIAIFVLLMPVAASAQWTGNITEEVFVKEFKRWSYYQEVRSGSGHNEYSVTFMAPSLVKMWEEYESDEYSKKRIKSLYESMTKHGYSIFVLGFKINYTTSLDISPVSDNITLQIVEKDPKNYSPIAFSNNLNRTMLGINDNTFYGVVAYNTPPDMFSFQNLSIDAICKYYYRDDFDKVMGEKPHWLQFSFMPNGVPRTNKEPQTSRAYFDIGTAIDILSVGLQIVSMLM